MAFGTLTGTMTNIGTTVAATNNITGSIAVSVGDLIFVLWGEITTNGSTGVTDNLGNTYTAQNAGTLSTVSGRAFWSIATVAGTLTTVTVAATAGGSTAWSAVVAVIQGPCAANASQPDANPANSIAGTTSPFSAPASGTLAQASEIVMAWAVVTTSVATWSATSPNLLANQAQQTSTRSILGYQAVSSTSSVTPQFTAGTNPTHNIMGTVSFKAGGAAAPSATLPMMGVG